MIYISCLNKILNVVYKLLLVNFIHPHSALYLISLILYINCNVINGFHVQSNTNINSLSIFKNNSIEANTHNHKHTRNYIIENPDQLLYHLDKESNDLDNLKLNRPKSSRNYADNDNNFYSISELFSQIKEYYKTHKGYPFPLLTRVLGSVSSIRRIPSQNIIFIDLNDGSTIDNLQIVISNTHKYGELESINVGDDVLAIGNIDYRKGKPSERALSEFDLYIYEDEPAHKIKIYSNYDEGNINPVLPNVDYSDEYLRRYPHLRFQNKRFGCVMRIRSELMSHTYEFFSKHKFCYIETPCITRMNCENLHSFHLKTPEENELTSCSFLSPTGQMELEFACYALRRVWKIGPSFRSEVSDTTRHSPEFSMIEAEWSNASLEGMIRFIEKYIQSCAQCLLENCKEYVRYLNKFDNKYEEYLRHLSVVKIKVITYDEAVNILNEILQSDGNESKNYGYGPVNWGKRLTESNERALIERFDNQIVAITNYPESISPFYMKESANNNVASDIPSGGYIAGDNKVKDEHGGPNCNKRVDNFDIIAPFGYEIAGGSLREDKYERLRRKMEILNMNEKGYQRYLDLRKYRYLPHGGFGIGFDRLVMLMTKRDNIRDVKPFDYK